MSYCKKSSALKNVISLLISVYVKQTGIFVVDDWIIVKVFLVMGTY